MGAVGDDTSGSSSVYGAASENEKIKLVTM